MNKSTTRQWVVNLAKISVAAAAIVAIAFTIVTLKSPIEGVADAEADIISSFFRERSNQQRFVEALIDEGFEKPRSYDYNGNKFFFSMMETSESPREVLMRMQRSFVKAGLNKRVYADVPPELQVVGEGEMTETIAQQYLDRIERYDDMFGGGLVPTVVTSDYVAMAGTKSRNDAPDAAKFLLESLRSGSLHKAVGTMRYIEAWHNEDARKTTVTAVWSDEELDLEKFRKNSDRADLAVDTEIPACIGCTRQMRFAGEGKESQYVTTVFSGHNTVDDTIRFYDRALGVRGWQRMGHHDMIEKMTADGHVPHPETRFATYGRDAESLTILVYPDPITGQSVVHVVQAP